MTDIDELRQRVIDAARAWNSAPSPEEGDAFEVELCRAIDALDAAETPDPWELLREIRPFAQYGSALANRIDAALAWREQHND